jgi:hypothetical protein
MVFFPETTMMQKKMTIISVDNIVWFTTMVLLEFQCFFIAVRSIA